MSERSIEALSKVIVSAVWVGATSLVLSVMSICATALVVVWYLYS